MSVLLTLTFGCVIISNNFHAVKILETNDNDDEFVFKRMKE